MGSILNKRWLFPLKLGALAGMIVGYNHVSWLIQYYDYLRYRLYNTAVPIVALEVDRWVLIISAAIYAVWFVYLAGKKLNSKVRIAYWAIILILAGIYPYGRYEIAYRLHEFNSRFFTAAYEESKVQLIAAVLVIIFGLCYFRIRRAAKLRRPDLNSAPSVSIIRLIKSGVVGIERQSWFFGTVLVVFLGLNLTMGVLSASAKMISRNKPNVIIIMVDTLRSDHVGCYGYARNTTPNIDNFAKGSTRFSKALANSSWTMASVSSFMSSQLPQTTLAVAHGDKVYQSLPDDNEGGISPKCITLAQKLHDTGYTTAGITSNPQYSLENNGAQGFDFFDQSNVLKETSSPSVLSVAKKWIAGNQDKRFFLFTLFLDTHSPYRRHPGFDFDPSYKGADADKIVDLSKNCKSTTKHMLDLYDSGVSYTDHHVGLLLDELKKRKLYDKSLIVIMADHGEEFRDHGSLFHGETLYNEVVSVPLMIKLPYQTEGRVVKGTFPLIDLFPTILSSLKLDPASVFPQGKAVDLKNVREVRDQYIYAQTNLHNVDLSSVQSMDYKYVLDHKKGVAKLFDVRNDPSEMRNIAVKNPTLAETFKKMVLAKDAESQRIASVTDVTGFQRMLVKSTDKKERADRMRSLGYMQ